MYSTLLQYAVVLCAALHCTVLFCTALYCSCTVLYLLRASPLHTPYSCDNIALSQNWIFICVWRNTIWYYMIWFHLLSHQYIYPALVMVEWLYVLSRSLSDVVALHSTALRSSYLHYSAHTGIHNTQHCSVTRITQDATLQCTVLHYTLLRWSALYYTTLYCTVLYYTVLCCIFTSILPFLPSFFLLFSPSFLASFLPSTPASYFSHFCTFFVSLYPTSTRHGKSSVWTAIS